MEFRDYLIHGVRKIYRITTGKKFAPPISIYDREKANKLIYDALNESNPCMISRFGTTELITINNYIAINSETSIYKKLLNYVTDNTHTPWWFKDNFHFLQVYSGVFPPSQKTSEKFAQRYLNDIPEIDILGSFQYYEKFMPLNDSCIKVHLETLYPFFVDNPWTEILKGKKVLVIHPFDSTINFQYNRREKLFDDSRILPEFDLVTYKSVQSAANMSTDYKSWFEALEHMQDEISKIDFDISLIGCGAYGMPLAAYIKRMGKKAVHLGGGLQLLFGIKGKRWDNPDYGVKEFKNYPNLMAKPYCSLYNDYWIKPKAIDTPKESKNLDGATYW